MIFGASGITSFNLGLSSGFGSNSRNRDLLNGINRVNNQITNEQVYDPYKYHGSLQYDYEYLSKLLIPDDTTNTVSIIINRHVHNYYTALPSKYVIELWYKDLLLNTLEVFTVMNGEAVVHLPFYRRMLLKFFALTNSFEDKTV